jgi:hypothetical protein
LIAEPARLQRVEILREGLEWPGGTESRFKRLQAHALDLFQGLHDHLAMDFPGRGDAEAAIADHRGGDAVPGRDGEHAIPQDLRIVVCVYVDEARRDDLARGVDRLHGGPSALPSATTFPSLMPTSPAKPGFPVPSTMVPPVILRSKVMATPGKRLFILARVRRRGNAVLAWQGPRC